MKTKLFILLLLIAASQDSVGNQPRRSYPYRQYSANAAFYYESIPFSVNPWGPGKTYVYRAGDSNLNRKPLYTVDDYFYRDTRLSDDGSTIIRIATQLNRYAYRDLSKRPLITWYVNGSLRQTDRMPDLFPDTTVLNLTGNNKINWQYRYLVSNDTLYLLLAGNESLGIRISSRKEIFRGPKALITARLKVRNQVINSGGINAPEMGFPYGTVPLPMPKIHDGTSLDTALEAFVRRSNVAGSMKLKYIIEYGIMIDRAGNCSLYNFGEAYYSQSNPDILALRKKAQAWVRTIHCKDALIPAPCEKWLFQGYLNLTP